jgi:hypothetical protein
MKYAFFYYPPKTGLFALKVERKTGLEPATTSLEGWSSTN